MNRNGENGGNKSEGTTGNEIVVETGNKTGNIIENANKTGSEIVDLTKAGNDTTNIKKSGSETINIKKTGTETIGLKKSGSETANLRKIGSKIGSVNKIGFSIKVGNGNKTKTASEHMDKNCTVRTVQAPLVCSCMATTLKVEMANAQTQTEVIILKTVGLQCQRILEPLRRLATKRTITPKNAMAEKAVEDKRERLIVKDDAENGRDKSSFPVCQDGVVVT